MIGVSCNDVERATHLSIRTSLEGSMDARRDAGPDGRRDERRRSEALLAAWVAIVQRLIDFWESKMECGERENGGGE